MRSFEFGSPTLHDSYTGRHYSFSTYCDSTFSVSICCLSLCKYLVLFTYVQWFKKTALILEYTPTHYSIPDTVNSILKHSSPSGCSHAHIYITNKHTLLQKNCLNLRIIFLTFQFSGSRGMPFG